MPLLNDENDLQTARLALMKKLHESCDKQYLSGWPNGAGEETTIFEKGDGCVELSSKGGLIIRPLKSNGGQARHYLGGRFGGHASWQMAQEIDGYVLYHTTQAHHVAAEALISAVQDQVYQIEVDHYQLLKICSISDDNALEQIIKIALLCDEARQPTDHVNPSKPSGGGCDPGPSEGGERSAATWSARQSPYVKEIGRVLDKLGWNEEINGRPWQPDLLRGSPGSDKQILIEVKPDCSTHNVITAIGQVTCYSSDMDNVVKVIAGPWSNSPPYHITNVLESYNIKILDLDEGDLMPRVRVIVE